MQPPEKAAIVGAQTVHSRIEVQMRARFALVMVPGAVVLAACGSATTPTSTVTTPPVAPDCAKGTLTFGPPLTGGLNAAGECLVVPFMPTEIATYKNSYTLPVQAGSGYLVTMHGQNPFFPPILAMTS